MSGAREPLRDIRAALRDVARRLDVLGAPPGQAEAPAAGDPLDERTRTGLAALGSLLAIRPGVAPDTALLLAVDRLIHQAGSDCAAVLVPGADGRLGPAFAVGLPRLPPDLDDERGTIRRAFREREPILGGTATSRPDALATALGLACTAAVAVPGEGDGAAGVVFVGRRRAVQFDLRGLEIVTLAADRIGLVLREAAAAGRPAPAAGFGADLDLDRVAARLCQEAAARLGAPAVALLLPDAEGFRVVGARDGAPATTRVSAAGGVLGRVAASAEPWRARERETDRALDDLLGAPARLALPLLVEGRVVAILAAGGPAPPRDADLSALLAEAAPAVRNARLYRDAVDALVEVRAMESPAPAPPPAHDFANLLAVVLGRLAVVRERVRDDAVARELDVAEEAAWRAAEAVRGLLGFAPGQRAAALLPLDLSTVIRDTVVQVEARWTAADARRPPIRLDLEAVPPVRGSAEDLREALEHLLENAAESGSEEGHVTVHARWDGGGRVEVSVEDRGAGMDEPTRRRALEPFFTSKGPGRLGLGLPVVQAIVARHHGDLEIVSAPGLGTTVRIALPTVSSGRRLGAGETGTPARVLLVEDEVPVRDALVASLIQQGHVAHVAGDGRAALALLAREPIDLVVTDLALPGMSGLELARTVRGLRPGTPVILVTGWPGGTDPGALEESGVDAVIEKPVGLAEFRAALSVALARRRVSRP